MAITEKDEKRALSKGEYDIVKQTRAPVVDRFNQPQLRDLAAQLRRYRDKAKDLSHGQRREMRGKTAPRAASAATGNTSQTYKQQILNNALRRVNRRLDAKEAEKKRKHDLKAAQKALEGRRQMLDERAANRLLAEDMTPESGPSEITNPNEAVFINPMERGRVSQFVKNAQGKRDSQRADKG